MSVNIPVSAVTGGGANGALPLRGSSSSDAPPRSHKGLKVAAAVGGVALVAAAVVLGVLGGTGRLSGSSSSAAPNTNGAGGGGNVEGGGTDPTPTPSSSGTATPSSTFSAGATPSSTPSQTGTPSATGSSTGTPSGTPTRSGTPTPSPSMAPATGPGALLVGRVIDKCIHPNTVALTFDDGPTAYTADVLDILNRTAPDARVTFFVNGQNWGGCIYDLDRSMALQRAYKAGHQIGSHTWSHADLTNISAAQQVTEVTRLETALSKILGVVPAFMRPPYGHNSPQVTQFLRDRGYAIITWDVDSGDFALAAMAGMTNTTFRNSIVTTVGATSAIIPHIVLNHDTNALTATVSVPALLQWATSRGYQMVTVGECLGYGTPQQMYQRIDASASTIPDITWSCT